MKEKKPMIKKLRALLILSCSPLFETPTEVAGGSGETWRVVLSVSTGGAAAARTVLPAAGLDIFGRYELVVSREGSEDVTVSNTADIDDAGVSQELAAGDWTATVTAYQRFNTDGPEYLTARGSSPIEVVAGETTQVTVPFALLPVEDGPTEAGFFDYTVNYPNGVSVTLTLDGEGLAVPSYSGRKLSVEKAPGYYDLFITATKGTLTAGRSEKVHIYAGLRSEAEFTFAEDDFVELAYLVGTLSLPGGVSISSGTITAYSNSGYSASAQIGSAQPAEDGSWVIGIAHSYAMSDVYLKAEITGADEKIYTGTASTGPVPEEGVQGIELADTTPPARVRFLEGTTPGSGKVTLRWTDPGDSDLDHIKISWDSDSETVTKGTETYTAMNLTDGTPYTFTVTAGNESAGETATGTPYGFVTNIAIVRTAMMAGERLTLTGMVEPPDAMNKTIV
jgi:hypothetical protein